MKKFGLLISGFGGQGVLYAGYLLAYASMLAGKKISWIPSYGVEMRGGTANCTVMISDEEINSPVVEKPDALIAFNTPSLEKFMHTVNDSGIVLMNGSLVPVNQSIPNGLRTLCVAANHEAQRLGNIKIANLIMIGALIKVTNLVHIDYAIRALTLTLPKHHHNILDLNEQALKVGYECV